MEANPKAAPTAKEVKDFWEGSPLCSTVVNESPGTQNFFLKYDALREINEPPEFAKRLHEYAAFSNKKVLEVGCGNAYTLAKYAEYGAQVYGIDITENAVKISKDRFRLKGLSGDFRVGDAEQLPYESNFFDCICSMGVLHHVPNTIKAVSEIHRCLKPGGRLIVMFYHRNSLHYMLTLRIFSLLTAKSIKQTVNEYDGIGNPKGEVYSKRELKGLLYNFVDLELFAGYIKVPFTRIIVPSSMTNLIGKNFGWFLYAKANKRLN